MARLSILDTRHSEYQHAHLGTSEIALDAGTVFVTIFPNCTISLFDPGLMDALKIHVRLLGTPQHRDSTLATLHYQLAW